MREKRFSFEKDADWQYTKKSYYKPCTSGLEMTRGQEIILITFMIIMTIVALTCCIVFGIKVVQENSYQLEQSKKINETYKAIYCTKINGDKNYVTKQTMDELQKIYDEEQLEIHQRNLYLIQCKIATEEIPPGTFIRVITTDTQVRVKSWDGFQAITYDGPEYTFNFAYDEWEFSDYNWYSAQCIAQERTKWNTSEIKKLKGNKNDKY